MDADKEPSFLNKLEKNLSKHYLFTLFARLNLEQGVWMLYLASKGLTFFQIGLMETIFPFNFFSHGSAHWCDCRPLWSQGQPGDWADLFFSKYVVDAPLQRYKYDWARFRI